MAYDPQDISIYYARNLGRKMLTATAGDVKDTWSFGQLSSDADSARAIRDAIEWVGQNGYGVINIPAGEWICDSPAPVSTNNCLFFGYSGLTFRGEGQTATKLVLGDSVNIAMLKAGLSSGTITGIDVGNPTVIHFIPPGTLPVVGEKVIFSGIAGTTELNNTDPVVTALTSNTFTVDAATTNAWDSGGRWFNKIEDLEISDLTIDGNWDEHLDVSALDGIQVTACERLWVHDIAIRGVRGYGSTGAIVVDSVYHNVLIDLTTNDAMDLHQEQDLDQTLWGNHGVKLSNIMVKRFSVSDNPETTGNSAFDVRGIIQGTNLSIEADLEPYPTRVLNGLNIRTDGYSPYEYGSRYSTFSNIHILNTNTARKGDGINLSGTRSIITNVTGRHLDAVVHIAAAAYNGRNNIISNIVAEDSNYGIYASGTSAPDGAQVSNVTVVGIEVYPVLNFGNLTANAPVHGLEAAFDNGTVENIVTCASSVGAVTSAYIGRTYEGPIKLRQATIHGSANHGYLTSVNQSITVNIRGKAGVAPTSATDGTIIGTITFTDTASEEVGRTITSTDTASSWDHVWAEITTTPAATINVAELVIDQVAQGVAVGTHLARNITVRGLRVRNCATVIETTSSSQDIKVGIDLWDEVGTFMSNAGARTTVIGPDNRVILASTPTPKTAAYTLTTYDSGKTFSNTGTTARVDFTLPTAVAGLGYSFSVDDTDGIRVKAAAGDTITTTAGTSSVAGQIDDAVIGSFITIRAVDATKWVATVQRGTWTAT